METITQLGGQPFIAFKTNSTAGHKGGVWEKAFLYYSLDALAHDELCVCDIAQLVGLSESAVSHQLRLLRGTRLVRARRDGRQMFYTLDDDHIVGLLGQGLEHIEERAGHKTGGGR